MITTLKRIAGDNYATYVDAQTLVAENHRYRLVAQFLLAALALELFSRPTEAFISVVVTALSVFTGFAFSAMFPIAVESISNLRAPLFSDDKDDIKRLRTLTSAFRANVSYFVPLSLAAILLFVVQLLKVNSANTLATYLTAWFEHMSYTDRVSSISVLAGKLIAGISLFCFFEVLYTFYRMCLSVLAILRIRDEYCKTGDDI